MSEEEKKEQIQEKTPAAEKEEPEPRPPRRQKPAEGAETAGEEKKSGQPSAADLLKSEVDLTVRKAKGSKNVTSGIVTILATFNNTKVSFSDKKGNVISWSSAGKMNFRGSAQKHGLRRAGGHPGCWKSRPFPRDEGSGSPCQGSGHGP
jgi:small subunit ribosomal protein S11